MGGVIGLAFEPTALIPLYLVLRQLRRLSIVSFFAGQDRGVVHSFDWLPMFR
jgi:hypothetical protein